MPFQWGTPIIKRILPYSKNKLNIGLKLVVGLQNMMCEQRLVLGLTTFKTRMLIADFIQVLEMLNDLDRLNK